MGAVLFKGGRELMLILKIIGWAVVALLAISIIHSGFFHSRNYARMQYRVETGADPTGIGAQLAKRYMRRTIFMQCIKGNFIVVLVYILLWN